MADSSALSERIARVTDVGSNGSNTADASTDAITPQAASHAAPTPRAPMTRAKPTREDRIAQGMLSEREHELVRDAGLEEAEDDVGEEGVGDLRVR